MGNWSPSGRVISWVRINSKIDVDADHEYLVEPGMVFCPYPIWLTEDVEVKNVSPGFEARVHCRIKDGGEYRYAMLYARKCAYESCKGDCNYCHELYKMVK